MPDSATYKETGAELSRHEWRWSMQTAGLSASETLSGQGIVNAYPFMLSLVYSTGIGFLNTYWPPTWVSQAVGELNELLTLPNGWDTYGAPAVSYDAAYLTLRVLTSVMRPQSRLPRIEPTALGGVSLEWFKNGVEVAIDVTPSRQVTAFFTNRHTSETWEGELNEAPARFWHELVVLSQAN
jgi:hypothetical protein